MKETQQAEFLEQVDSCMGIVKKVVYLYSDHPDDAADLYQEILLQAWKGYSRFRGEARFSTWLYQVSLNTAMLFRKKENRRPEIHGLRDTDQVDHSGPAKDQKGQLLWAIRQLRKVDRTIILLHLEGYSNPEIAKTLDIKSNALGVRLHRIKKRIGELIKKEEKV